LPFEGKGEQPHEDSCTVMRQIIQQKMVAVGRLLFLTPTRMTCGRTTLARGANGAEQSLARRLARKSDDRLPKPQP
jgi:hypothetical protein